MNKTHSTLPIIFLAAWLAGCSSTPHVDSDKGACYLKAAHNKVYVKVFNLDRDRNIGPIVFQGIINQRENTLIKTAHAQFRFYYNSDPLVDRPLSSGQDQVCDDHDVVVIP